MAATVKPASHRIRRAWSLLPCLGWCWPLAPLNELLQQFLRLLARYGGLLILCRLGLFRRNRLVCLGCRKQALKIGEIQKLYNNAKENLPERARALLDPLEDLSSRVVYSRSDLNRFLKQWDNLRDKIQELRPRESEGARRLLDEIHNIQASIRLGDRIQEWQEAYTRLRENLPSRPRLSFVKFDAINNRIIYSRQELQRIWSQTLLNLRQLKLWQIRPWKFTRAMIKDFSLTTSFAFSFREFSKQSGSQFGPG